VSWLILPTFLALVLADAFRPAPARVGQRHLPNANCLTTLRAVDAAMRQREDTYPRDSGLTAIALNSAALLCDAPTTPVP
jgi:hypothetical protein